MDYAVAAAKAAFRGPWAGMTGAARAKCMLKLADLLDENLEALMKLERIAMGQPKALVPVFGSALSAIWRHFAGYCDKLPGAYIPEGHSQTYKVVRYEPLGVCAGIAAWNGTLLMLCLKIAPAIAAGNTFVFKSSEKSPLGSLAIGELIIKAGFPPGVINLLSGPGETGALLASHMEVKRISYTGSASSGRKVQIAATESNLKRVDLELGGKSASIIFKDADLKNALAHASKGFLVNSGQICVAASRILVQEELAEEFLEGLTALFKTYIGTLGDPELETTFLGPMADKAQTERVMSFLKEGDKDGATILVGGHSKGNFIEPTLIKNPSIKSRIWKQEIFGPVLAIRTFKTEQEAINIANSTDYGLSSCVFTTDIVRALRVSEALEAGFVSINSAQSLNFDTPFGGWKESGNGGTEGGFESILNNLRSKVVTINMQVNNL